MIPASASTRIIPTTPSVPKRRRRARRHASSNSARNRPRGSAASDTGALAGGRHIKLVSLAPYPDEFEKPVAREARSFSRALREPGSDGGGRPSRAHRPGATKAATVATTGSAGGGDRASAAATNRLAALMIEGGRACRGCRSGSSAGRRPARRSARAGDARNVRAHGAWLAAAPPRRPAGRSARPIRWRAITCDWAASSRRGLPRTRRRRRRDAPELGRPAPVPPPSTSYSSPTCLTSAPAKNRLLDLPARTRRLRSPAPGSPARRARPCSAHELGLHGVVGPAVTHSSVHTRPVRAHSSPPRQQGSRRSPSKRSGRILHPTSSGRLRAVGDERA